MVKNYKRFGADNEYAGRVLKTSPGNITTFALQNKSEGPRNVLARAASEGRYDADSLLVLVKIRQREPRSKETREFVQSLKPAPLLALAVVLANQSLRSMDAYDAVLLFKAVIGHHGVHALKWNERLVFLELLAAKRWFKDVKKYVELLGIASRDKSQPGLLKANVLNPFSTGEEDSSDQRVQTWFEEVNAVLSDDGLEPIGLAPGSEAPIDRILCAPSSFVDEGPEVTVIIPTYDPGPRIETAVESLVVQSYRNLQILIMDDATPEERARDLDRWEERDDRIRVIHLPENAGTYRARNIAVSQYATGEFITVHDDDDWSHPRKIELQVNQLLSSPETLANVSMLSRTTESLQFARINNNAVFTQRNFSSLMIRRSVFDELGYWDVVNRSADAEMYDRIVAVTGQPIPAVGRAPASFLRIRDASLTSGEIHKGYIDSRRVWYQRLSRAWHEEELAAGNRPYVSLDFPAPRPFPAPVGMIGSKQVQRTHEYDVVYATDFRFPGGNSSLAVREIHILLAMGLRVALLQMDSPLLGAKNQLHPDILSLLSAGGLDVVSLLDSVSARLLIARHPTVLQYPRVERSALEVERVVVIVNHAPYERNLSGSVYDVSDVVNNAEVIFGQPPTVAPESGLIRELVRGLVDPALLAKFNWEGTVSTIAEQVSHKSHEEPPVIGRHSRDATLKWPEPDVLRQVYPVDASVDVRVLGGAAAAAEKLGEMPDNWTVYGFGEKTAAEFLSELDFWVYFHSEDLHESFGMATAEALAAGLVTILPPYMKATFGEGAVYCQPENVQFAIAKLWADPAAYKEQRARAIAWAQDRFGTRAFIERIESLL